MLSRLLATVFVLTCAPAFAAQPFDGAWSLTAATQSGNCQSYTFDVAVSDGIVQTPAGVAVSGTGRVSPQGAVAINFAAGSDTISASGKAQGTSASGRWSAPTLACAGTWSARRH